MKKCIVWTLLLILLCGAAWSANAELEKNPLLDAAFSCLEKDNIFQRRYNELTGSNVESLFELGVPYFFGTQVYDGKLLNKTYLVSKYPDYAIKICQEITKTFRKGEYYIYGFDCSGYTRWIYDQCGLRLHPGLQDMIVKYDYLKNHLYDGGTKWTRPKKEMPAYNELKDTLQVGDLLVTKHSARHIMMYIGTLADYGFTAEEVPDLAPYLDYPLVIHCGPSPFYGERFQKLIDENPRYKNCHTTNGGVEVSIIGVKPEDAACHTTVFHTPIYSVDYDYFLIDDGNYMLTLRDIENATSFCWYRM